MVAKERKRKSINSPKMIIKKYNSNKSIGENKHFGKVSKHVAENPKRLNEFLKGKDSNDIVGWFWVQKFHPNGPEVHVVYKDASVLIFNEKSGKLCTILFARPGQIKRYYRAIGKTPSKDLMEYAYYNQQTGKNKM